MKDVCSKCWYLTHNPEHGAYRCCMRGACPAYDRWEDPTTASEEELAARNAVYERRLREARA